MPTPIPLHIAFDSSVGAGQEHGGDEEQAVAALLHNAVEDADTTKEAEQRRAEIKERFGDRVARS